MYFFVRKLSSAEIITKHETSVDFLSHDYLGGGVYEVNVFSDDTYSVHAENFEP